MTTSVFTFTMMLDAILADLRAVEDEEYGFDLAMKGLDYAIKECFGPRKTYGYIAD